MPITKRNLTVTKDYELRYDPNSKEFTEALKGYRECMEPKAREKDMIRHVILYIDRFGIGGMVEGVGWVKSAHSQLIPPNPYSGIEVIESQPDPEIEFN